MTEATVEFGKYELVSRLAMGGMAELFLAREKGMAGLERLVVIKRILPHLSHQKSFVEMFLREARIAARLNHPNVVNIFELNTLDGAYYIAMEYIHGTTVREIQVLAGEAGLRFPLDVMVSIVDQSSRGLHAAHELRDLDGKMLGVVHRDVSPHNLMCTPHGNVKLLDFGVAKATAGVEMTYSGNLKGKFAYMSPEQCHRSQLDRRSDIFSLGTIAWELSTGHRLFKRHTELEMLKAITNGEIPRPSELCPEMPLELEDVIMRALRLDRDRRYLTAEEMREDLALAARKANIEYGPDKLAMFVRRVAGPQLSDRDEAMKHALERSLSLNERRHLLHRTGSHTIEELETGLGGIESQTRTLPSSSLPTFEGENLDTGAPANRSLETKIALSASDPAPASAPETAPIPVSKKMRPIWMVAAGLVVAGLALATFSVIQSQRQHGTVLLGEPMRFGWAPTVTKDQLAIEVEVLRGYLEKTLGRPVPMIIADDYDDLRVKLVNGELEYAMMPPYLYVITKQEVPDLKPLVFKSFDGAPASDGMLLVRMDGSIDNLEDLKGRIFCFTDKKSTTGYLMPRSYIRREGFDPNTFVGGVHWSGNHTQVMKDLLDGKCDAAATYSGSYLSAESLGIKAGRIRTLASTGTVPQDIVVASPKVRTADMERVRDAFLNFDPEAEFGTRLVGKTQRMESFLPASDEAFKGVREAILVELETTTE